MHIVMLSTFNPSLTVVSSRVVRVHNRLRFFRGARIVLDFFFGSIIPHVPDIQKKSPVSVYF